MGRFGGSPFFGSFREVLLDCLKPRKTSISSCFQANTSPEISFGGRRGILAFWECLTKYPLRPPCREFPPSSPHALSSHPSVSTRHTEATRSVASATARDVSGRQQSSARRTVSPRPAMNRSWTALVGHGVTAPRIKRQPPPLPGPNRPSGHRGTDTLVRFGVRSLNHLSVNSTLVRQPGAQSLRTRTAQTKKINCLSADMVFGTSGKFAQISFSPDTMSQLPFG